MELRFRACSFAFAAWVFGVLVWIAPVAVHAQCPAQELFHPSVSLGGSIGEQTVAADVNADGTLDLVDAPGVAVADFNADGKLDIAATGSVQVRLGVRVAGRGIGSFLPPVALSGGITDVTDPTDSIGILLGRGNGTFEAAVRYPTSRFQARVATGDFDSNGIVDLAIGNVSAPGDTIALSILLGRGDAGVGDGTFDLPSQYRRDLTHYNEGTPYVFLNYDIAVSDFNRDGISDVALLSGPDGSFVWLFQGRGVNGRGDGTFNTLANAIYVAYLGRGLEVSDFDEDGIPDIAVSSSYQGVSILRGLGAGDIGPGTFAAPDFYPLGPTATASRDLVVADFNHDGIADLAVSGIRDNSPHTSTPTSLAVLLGTGANGVGNGAFARAVYYADIQDYQRSPLVQGDFNEDGAVDLVTGPGAAMFAGRCPGSAASAPFLVSVRDVPNDQGGRVSVMWNRSALDAPSIRVITDYTIWRRISPVAAKASGLPQEQDPLRAIEARGHVVRTRPGIDSGAVTYWEALQTVPAHFLEGYGYTAETTQDSIAHRNPYTAFFVSAVTEDRYFFFESNVDSGYSADNLAPGIPKGLAGRLLAPGTLALHWRPNSEADLHHYSIYRGTEPSFVPSGVNRIGNTADTTFVDAAFGTATFYRVTAVDVHGNESPNPPVVTGAGTGVPLVTALVAPFDPHGAGPIELRYAIAEPHVRVQLGIYDVSGRLIWSSDEGHRDEGEYRRLWNREDGTGRRVARGVYMVRLHAGKRLLAKKLVLLSD